MRRFKGKTAVITGAGSGIGRALAHEAAGREMNLVLVDINGADLNEVKGGLESSPTLAIEADVSDSDALKTVAEATERKFGPVHLLVNNAGVSAAPQALWDLPEKDWGWVTGVNLSSVYYGVKAFVPAMLAHGEPAHIVNTASIAGLTSNSFMNAYAVTKHAVVALSETLFLDLQAQEADIGVSVLCPAWIRTRIHLSERNRPAAARTDPTTLGKKEQQTALAIGQLVENGLRPEQVAEEVFKSVENDTFYILTHPPFNKFIEARHEAILEGRPPRASW